MNSAGDDNGVELAKHVLPRRQGLLVHPLPARQAHAHARGQAAMMLITHLIQAEIILVILYIHKTQGFLFGGEKQKTRTRMAISYNNRISVQAFALLLDIIERAIIGGTPRA